MLIAVLVAVLCALFISCSGTLYLVCTDTSVVKFKNASFTTTNEHSCHCTLPTTRLY